jgi:endonuclease/exonuclease/phosphatase family metal-dependent hydrolase
MTTEKEVGTKKSRTNWFVMIFNWGAIVALILSYLATHIAPSTFGYLALFGLAYPFILLANLLFISYWLLKKRKNALFSAIAILIGINHFTDFFQISFTDDINPARSTIKVLTYNVHLFDLYNAKSGTVTRDKIYDVLVREKADVICFQEFFDSEKKGYFPTRDTIVKFLPNKYIHERYTHALSGQQFFGVAMFSKYPIIKRGHVPFSSDANNFCIYADIVKGKDTLRIYNAHLQSIRFKPEDYALVDGNKNKEELDKGGKRIARRLKDAFVKRQEQVERIAESIETSPYEVIMCGDFNDPPVSYTYGKLTDILEDSFLECGNGIGNTYIGVFPSFRIDYIMHTKGLDAVAYNTIPEKLSDHHAITSTFVKKEKTND